MGISRSFLVFLTLSVSFLSSPLLLTQEKIPAETAFCKTSGCGMRSAGEGEKTDRDASHSLKQEQGTIDFNPSPTLAERGREFCKRLENQVITVQGQKVVYDVHSDAIQVRDMEGKESADIFFIAYFAQHSQEKSSRPIAFCFNGGPGSSSVWLHMGFLGPKILCLPLQQAGQSFPYEENHLSLLAFCDLVFIDPVFTGFSRPTKEGEEKKFCGVEEDVHSLAEFIQAFLTKFQRWQSVKLLIGESYGTLRAAGLTSLLQNKYYINIDGLIFLSSVLDCQTLDGRPSQDLTNILNLPTYAAIAHYYKKLGPPYSNMGLEELAEKVSSFAMNQYAPVLLAGSSAQESVKDSMAQQLSQFTSLPSSFFRAHNLRLGPDEFSRELLKETSSIVGRLDGQIETWLPPKECLSSFTKGLDPSFFFTAPHCNSAMQEYLAKELGWLKNEPYLILNNKVFLTWNWNTKNSASKFEYLSYIDDLKDSFAKNPQLKLFVAAGYYDLATPFFTQRYTLDHLFLPENLGKNVTFKVYKGGHMMYLDKEPREKLSLDLFQFVSSIQPLHSEK